MLERIERLQHELAAMRDYHCFTSKIVEHSRYLLRISPSTYLDQAQKSEDLND